MTSENLGEFLTGDRIETSRYNIFMQHNLSCLPLCQVRFQFVFCRSCPRLDSTRDDDCSYSHPLLDPLPPGRERLEMMMVTHKRQPLWVPEMCCSCFQFRCDFATSTRHKFVVKMVNSRLSVFTRKCVLVRALSRLSWLSKGCISLGLLQMERYFFGQREK